MLVTMKEILERAVAGEYAVPAPNIGNSVEVDAAIMAAEEMKSPLILDVHFENLRSKMPAPRQFARWCCERAAASVVPIAINQDHGNFNGAVRNIQAGVSSVMCDSSMKPLEENIADVRKTVEVAHMCYGPVCVEAELGHVGHTETYDEDIANGLTNPDEAVYFVRESGCDFLAVSIGTSHGLYPKGVTPSLRFELFEEIRDRVRAEFPGFPLVLHGSSGTPNEQLYKICRMGINKVNIASDLGKAALDYILENHDKPNKGVGQMYRDGFRLKLVEMIPMYGSDGKAWVPDITASCYFNTQTDL